MFKWYSKINLDVANDACLTKISPATKQHKQFQAPKPTHITDYCNISNTKPPNQNILLIIEQGRHTVTSQGSVKATSQNNIKGSPVHVAPACTRSGEGSDHFGSIVRSLSLHFCKRLFPGLEPVTSWSQGSSFYHCAKAPLQLKNCIIR